MFGRTVHPVVDHERINGRDVAYEILKEQGQQSQLLIRQTKLEKCCYWSIMLFSAFSVVLLAVLTGFRVWEIFAAPDDVSSIDVNGHTILPYGLDVCYTNGHIKWETVFDMKHPPAFIWSKATESYDNVDETFALNYKAVMAFKTSIGGYHVAHPSASNGSTQAKYFLDNSYTDLTGQLLGAIQLGGKDCYGLTQMDMVDWVNEFYGTYFDVMKKSPWLYTTTAWWNKCIGECTWVPQEPWLWIQDITMAETPGELPKGFLQWDVWQYKENARIHGIPGRVGINRPFVTNHSPFHTEPNYERLVVLHKL